MDIKEAELARDAAQRLANNIHWHNQDFVDAVVVAVIKDCRPAPPTLFDVSVPLSVEGVAQREGRRIVRVL